MATNLDVDIAALEQLMRLGNFRSKREAVDAAVREAIQYRQQLKTLGIFGTIDFAQPELGPSNAPAPELNAEHP